MLRIVNLNNQWRLRINLGNGEYVWARGVRSAKREKDRWIDFVWDLTQAERTGNWFAYTVRLRLKKGKIYAQMSREENLPEITITKENGVIGIDFQADRVLFSKFYLWLPFGPRKNKPHKSYFNILSCDFSPLIAQYGGLK